jgi:hypothetical protein
MPRTGSWSALRDWNRGTVDDGEPVTSPWTEIVNRLRDPLFPSADLALYEDGAFSEQIDPAIRQHEVERISGCSARNDLSAGTMWIREKVTAAQTRSAPDKLVAVPRARTSASSAASIAAFAGS